MPLASYGERSCRSLADLVMRDPTIRVQVGTVHAAIDGVEVASTTPSLWVWSSSGRFAPRRFHEETLDGSVEAAIRFLDSSCRSQTASSLRVSDEQEGGIIIPDYMY